MKTRIATSMALCGIGLAACGQGGSASGEAGLGGGGAGPGAPWLATELLARPTASSVSVSVVPGQGLEIFLECGTVPGDYPLQTEPVAAAAGEPLALELAGLAADTSYRYRVRWRAPGETEFAAGPERLFHTARAAGQPFRFAVQADPHSDDKTNADLYRRTLANELADEPDFLVDLGDTFMCEKHSEPLVATVEPAASYPTVAARYLYERGNFGLVAHSAPLFLANGNHEGEAGWLHDGTGENIAVWASLARTSYYPTPLPDGFYTGNDSEEPFVGRRGGYYAWRWGDALFLVLDPYWYTESKQDGWGWTLGEAQAAWLGTTLDESDAAFRFVFIHNLVGGLDSQGRGGVEAAPFYEWGGQNEDGSAGFAIERPGWDMPVHARLVEGHVTAVFHGHDHVYVRQELDGIVYQELPQPGAANFNSGPTLAAEAHYETGVIVSSAGHLRITVGPDQAEVDYVRAYLPEHENSERHNGEVSDHYVLTPR